MLCQCSLPFFLLLLLRQTQPGMSVPPAPDSAAGTTAEAPFATIQKAIDSAAEGDTIQIAEGTYNLTATLNLNKNVKLAGETGKDCDGCL